MDAAPAPWRSLQAHRIEFAADALGMGRAPVDPAASGAAGESFLTCVNEKRHAARDRFAPCIGQHFIAVRASRKSSAARVERKARKNFAELVAEQAAFEIERVGGGAQALVA